MDKSGTVDRVDGAAKSQGVSTATATLTREVDPLSVTKRLQRDGRWPEAEPVKNRMIKEARQKGMDRGEAQSWAYAEIDRLYPPLTGSRAPATESQAVPEDPGVTGLGDLPADWPELPANASLQVEIAWVSANRLRVRSGTGVDLSRALSPAPSYAALSWLETSILFPSKFADISVKATAQQDDEKELIRREKMSIEEIRGILAEMLEG
ncbi:MAG: hypothetical protein IT422_22450 [Pirellulaceae bacterium]|nr:hypothetical protein [Pirellulaceae bacterium]